MKRWTLALCGLGAWMCTAAFAQNWTVYVPAEHDFRVLFPEPPRRSDEGGGVVAFRARSNEVEYAVFRHGGRGAHEDPRRLVEERLRRSLREDTPLRRMTEHEEQSQAAQYVYRARRDQSMHRMVRGPAGYYELSVTSLEGRRMVAEQTAQDFFATFQTSGTGIFTALGAIRTAVDEFCKDRTDIFSRTFCELRTCFYADHEQRPICTSLFGRR